MPNKKVGVDIGPYKVEGFPQDFFIRWVCTNGHKWYAQKDIKCPKCKVKGKPADKQWIGDE